MKSQFIMSKKQRGARTGHYSWRSQRLPNSLSVSRVNDAFVTDGEQISVISVTSVIEFDNSCLGLGVTG